MNDSREEIAKDSMSQIEFTRWKMLMKKIDSNAENISDLQKEINKLQSQQNNLYLKMQELWGFVRSNRNKI